MAKHEENKDVRLISNHTGINIDWAQHCIEIDKDATVGIRTWGRIDYLTHYCGWRAIKVGKSSPVEEVSKHIRITANELRAAKSFSRR